MKKVLKWVLIILVLYGGGILFFGPIVLLGFYLLFGWVWFLGRVLPEIQVDLPGWLTAIVCLTLVAIGVHQFCCWLTRHFQKSSVNREEPLPAWSWRRTFALVAVVVLMFVAGISGVGIAHQTVWIATSTDPFLQSGFRETNDAVAHNNVHQIALGSHSFQDQFQSLPPGAIFDTKGKALHGWQTMLLPYLEQNNLYKQIDLKFSWKDSKNAPHFKHVIFEFSTPGTDALLSTEGYALSHFSSNVRVIGGSGTLSLKQISDGTSNTLLMGQVGENHKPWGYPLNWRDPALGLNKSPHGFGNQAKQGAYFAFADGHVKFLSNKTNPEVLKALSTPNGGEENTSDN